jgi:hypothetical protein
VRKKREEGDDVADSARSGGRRGELMEVEADEKSGTRLSSRRWRLAVEFSKVAS